MYGLQKSLKEVLRLWSPSLEVKYSYLLKDAIYSAKDSDPDDEKIRSVRLKDILPPNPDYLNGLKDFNIQDNVKVDEYNLHDLLEYRNGLLTIEDFISDSRYDQVEINVDKDMVPSVKSLKKAVKGSVDSKEIFKLVDLIDQLSVETIVFDNLDKLKTHWYEFRSDRYLIKKGLSKLVSKLGLKKEIQDGVAVTIDPSYGPIFFSGHGLDAMKLEAKQAICSYLSAIKPHLPEFLDLRETYYSYAALGHFGLGTTLGILGFWGIGAGFELTPYSSIPWTWEFMELMQRVAPAWLGLEEAYRNSVSSKERQRIKRAAIIGLPLGPIVGGILHGLQVPVESPIYSPTQILSQSADTSVYGALKVAEDYKKFNVAEEGAPRKPSKWKKFKSIVKNPWVWLYGGSLAFATVYNVLARYLGLIPPSLTHGVGPEALMTDLAENLPITLVSWFQVYRKYKTLKDLNSDEKIESYISNKVPYKKIPFGRYVIRAI